MKNPKLNMRALKDAVNANEGWFDDTTMNKMRESLRAVAVLKREHAALLLYVENCSLLSSGYPNMQKHAIELLEALGIKS